MKYDITKQYGYKKRVKEKNTKRKNKRIQLTEKRRA